MLSRIQISMLRLKTCWDGDSKPPVTQCRDLQLLLFDLGEKTIIFRVRILFTFMMHMHLDNNSGIIIHEVRDYFCKSTNKIFGRAGI